MEALLQQRGVIRVADSGARSVPAAALFSRASSVRVKSNSNVAHGSVRFVGIGSRKEGSRGVRYLRAAPDGIDSGNAESGARGQVVEQAKAESASIIDEEQEPFRDAVESGQTIGEATTEQQFGEDHGKSADEAITHASKELYESKTHGKPEATKVEDPKTEKEEVSSDVWGSKDEGGSTHAFLDDSEKINFHGEDDESVLGIGGQRAGESKM